MLTSKQRQELQELAENKELAWTNNSFLRTDKFHVWDFEADCWMNDIYLNREEADKFMKSWCVYRSELESLK